MDTQTTYMATTEQKTSRAGEVLKKALAGALALVALATVLINASGASAWIGDPAQAAGQAQSFKVDQPIQYDPMLAYILSSYPMPGDPHDAEASVANLLTSFAGDSAGQNFFVRSVTADILRSMPLPYDDHDARAVFDEQYKAAMAKYLPLIEPKQAETVVVKAAVVVPQPWDPHDANAERTPAPGIVEASPAAPSGRTLGFARPVFDNFVPQPWDPHDAQFNQ